MIKLITTTTMFFTLFFTSIVLANNENKTTIIEVSVNIFSLNDGVSDKNISNILQQENMKASTVYFANAGESSLIDIGKSNAIKDDKLTMDIKVNDSATKYDINFQLENESDISMPGITSYNVGDDLVFTAKINDASKLIKVMTKVVDENDANQLAMNILKIARKLHLKNTSQQYFEKDNFWKSDARRFRKMSKNIITPQGHFFYLTNTDQNRAIKGAIEFNTPLDLETKTTEYNVGIRNFGLKDDQLTFVVLPGKTVLIGRWFSSVNLSIKEASFLTNEEVENLKAAAK
jgi:Tfp pilus assembly protein PilZ